MAMKAMSDHPCLCDPCLTARDAEISRVRHSADELRKAAIELRDAWTGPQTTLNLSKARKQQRAWNNFKLALANQYDSELTRRTGKE